MNNAIQKEKGNRKGGVGIVATTVISLSCTYLFISAIVDPIAPRFDMRGDLPMLILYISIMLAIPALTLSGPAFRQYRQTRKVRTRGRLTGMLPCIGLIILALAELQFPESVVAQLIACGISIGCSLAAWRMFSHMQSVEILTQSKNPDGNAHV